MSLFTPTHPVVKVVFVQMTSLKSPQILPTRPDHVVRTFHDS